MKVQPKGETLHYLYYVLICKYRAQENKLSVADSDGIMGEVGSESPAVRLLLVSIQSTTFMI